MFLGVELVRCRRTLEPAGEETAIIIEKMKDLGVLVGSDGPHHNVLKIKPPIVFTKENADSFVTQLDVALDAIKRKTAKL